MGSEMCIRDSIRIQGTYATNVSKKHRHYPRLCTSLNDVSRAKSSAQNERVRMRSLRKTPAQLNMYPVWFCGSGANHSGGGSVAVVVYSIISMLLIVVV